MRLFIISALLMAATPAIPAQIDDRAATAMATPAALTGDKSLPPATARHTLSTVFSSDMVINGVTKSADGRVFLPVQPPGPGVGPEIVEIRNGKPVAYPDAHWNGWKPGMDGADRFVGVNAIRVGPDGFLWVVDRGGPGIGAPVVPHGIKLVKIDLATDHVVRSYDLGSVTAPWSYPDDVRFKGDTAYITDAGKPGLIVFDLKTGTGRRVLEGHPSTVAQSPLIAEGKVVRDKKGDPIVVHADQLELSPDGRWLYYQPCNGRMSRIATRYLDDASLSEAERGGHVERFAETPSTGGTAIAADGTIYLSDVDGSRILTISPEGRIATLIADPRLVWVDAMWIDDNGDLLLPASQLNRTAGENGGADVTRRPISLYRLNVGKKPVRR